MIKIFGAIDQSLLKLRMQNSSILRLFTRNQKKRKTTTKHKKNRQSSLRTATHSHQLSYPLSENLAPQPSSVLDEESIPDIDIPAKEVIDCRRSPDAVREEQVARSVAGHPRERAELDDSEAVADIMSQSSEQVDCNEPWREKMCG